MKIPDSDLSIRLLSKRVDLSSFCCTNDDLNDFLKNDSLKNQDDLISKTYLCYYQEHLAGYFTLTTDTLRVKYVDDSDCVNDFIYPQYPAIKLARLATDMRYQKRGIGTYMLLGAVGLAIEVSSITGCRYITVDSKPESLQFYIKQGFKEVKGGPKREYKPLYLNMYPIIEGLEPTESLDPYVESI
ncbi:GNAT family N-acetyltransferase [uncultured Methanolobus sp.]|uniref:GNAT family N-acetyltransferase n=1 Tax=uncultured Methanolobus sp. TaxID=218300 RepID=UPI002AABEA1E|nr:GNAT family N-acetyltransferase [uncultured Methanolobus sp.]